MKLAALALLGALLGCSGLTETGGGIVGIEVRVPARDTVIVGDSLQLFARALDKNGDSVAATIIWATPDTTIQVDSATGVVTGLSAGLGRVQAIGPTLASALVTVVVVDTTKTTTSSSAEVIRPRR